MKEQQFVPCPGCGHLFPGPVGAPHRYIGASAGCWAAYEEVLAREYGEYAYPEIHRLTVDTYAVQHPGIASQQSTQSVWVHLSAMYLALCAGMDARGVTQKMRSMLARKSDFEWLDPPPKLGSLTIVDVNQATDLSDHIERVQSWARSVWQAWSPHHDRIRRFVEGQ